jgi:hypothetical protein
MKHGTAQSATLRAISDEVLRARTKFPGNKFMLAALTEEVGELAQALLQKRDRKEVVKEAIQVATVAIRIIEEGDASFGDISDQEAFGIVDPPPSNELSAARRVLRELAKDELIYQHHGEMCARPEAYERLAKLIREQASLLASGGRDDG